MVIARVVRLVVVVWLVPSVVVVVRVRASWWIAVALALIVWVVIRVWVTSVAAELVVGVVVEDVGTKVSARGLGVAVLSSGSLDLNVAILELRLVKSLENLLGGLVIFHLNESETSIKNEKKIKKDSQKWKILE